MTRLLFDASLIGIGRRNGVVSGLTRAATDLLSALAGRPDVQIALTSSLSFALWRSTRQVARQHPSLEFVGDAPGRDRLQGLLDEVLPSRVGVPTSRRRVAKLLQRLLDAGFDPLRGVDLSAFDVYHSPYHALPDSLAKAGRPARVLTVHDVIPLVRPDYFGLPRNFSGRDFDPEFNLLAAVQSLDPQAWVLCPSRATRDDLCTHAGRAIDPDRVAVVPFAASSLFRPCDDPVIRDRVRRRYGLPDGPYLLALSTLEPRKNLERVIRCFRRLVEQERVPDLTLVLAGQPGWQYEGILDLAGKSESGRQRVRIIGYVADEDLASLYSHALAFVYPSLYEGFGLPPLEAMQCGTPVISSDRSSLPEVVGDAGLLVNPEDEDALCDRMLALYEDDDLRRQCARRSLERSRAFSWDACARDTVAVYERAAAAR